MNTSQKPSTPTNVQESQGGAAFDLNVKVRFLMYVDERVAPRRLQVTCPSDATVQGLIDILSDTYGEGLGSKLRQRNLMAIVNGVSLGRNFRNSLICTSGEKDIEISFIIFMDHGG